MRYGKVSGRLAVLTGEGTVEKVSGGRCGSDPHAVHEDWGAFRRWAAGPPAAERLAS